MTTHQYPVDTLVVMSVIFRDSLNNPVDPTTVSLSLQAPSGSINLTSSVVRDSLGNYHADYIPTAVGLYQYQWIGTGAAPASQVGTFNVTGLLTDYSPPTTPTLNGYLVFIQNVMGIPNSVIPYNSPVIAMTFDVALRIVNRQLNAVDPVMYTLAVYNLGGDGLINYGPDMPGAPPVAGSELPFFANARKRWNIYGFVSGVIQSASDEGTSESMVIQKAAENFTLADIQHLKTPWGRAYLAIAQRCGSMWGLT